MTVPQLFEFEGEQVSVTEIVKRYPAYCDSTVRRALGEGATNLAGLAESARQSEARLKRAQKDHSNKRLWGRKEFASSDVPRGTLNR